MAVEINAFGQSDVGRSRTLNEDSFLVDPALGLFVVCDGMGGHAAGEIASRTACDSIQRYLGERRAVLAAVAGGTQPAESAEALLRGAIDAANATIYKMGEKDKTKRGMGTTCIALLVLGGKAIMGHVGDSRLYLLRRGQLHQLSEDHSFVVEAIKQGILKPEDAKKSAHANMVMRAVGPGEAVVADTLVMDVVPGDTFLLCSDGLHQYTEDAAELSQLLSAEPTRDVPSKLTSLANARGGVDNITAILVAARTPAPVSDEDSQRLHHVNAGFDALRRIEIFSDLSMPELVRVRNAAREVEVAEGEPIVREGDNSDGLFVLVEGSVRVQRHGLSVADLGAGHHFGEMALLNQRPRTATVVARTRCRLLALEREAVFQLMRHDPLLAAKVLWKLAQGLSLRLDDVYLLHDRESLNDETIDDGRPDTLADVQLPPAPPDAPGEDLPPPSHAARTAEPKAGAGKPSKETLRFGLYPSPFTRK